MGSQRRVLLSPWGKKQCLAEERGEEVWEGAGLSGRGLEGDGIRDVLAGAEVSVGI